MVQQRKQARTKPNDLLVLADEAVPAVQARGGRDPTHPRGGVRTALAPLPNFMRATSCSGAKAGLASRRETAAAPPHATKVVVVGAPPRVGRATCSSTMKGTVAAAHVCSYVYCSLKGHVRASVVPLDAFVASRRRLIKTQQSMKLKGASPFRKPNNGGAEGYFVEIHTGAGDAAPPGGSDVSCSDLSTQESVDDSCGSSVVISDGSLELVGSTNNRGRKDNETLVVDRGDDDFGACKSDISDELDIEREGNTIPEDCSTDAPKECSSDDISSALSGISFEDVSTTSDAASSQRKKVHVSGRRTSEERSKNMRPFKPKAPNFLPVETGPEVEKVDLRHQAVNDRRDAEEWMVDYALRKAVKKLARAQKRKVEMLVQAFETVLPTAVSEKEPVQHGDDKNSFTLSGPFQACS